MTAKQQEQVFNAIDAAPLGLTRAELQEVTGLEGNSVQPRVLELIKAGRVVEAGTRRTKHGRKAAVLQVASAA